MIIMSVAAARAIVALAVALLAAAAACGDNDTSIITGPSVDARAPTTRCSDSAIRS